MPRDDSVKVKIPHKFNLAILKVQVDNSLDWQEACLKAADLLNSNTEAFQKLVKKEAEKIYKKRFMTQLNKAKQTEHNKGYTIGYRDGRKTFEVAYPCSVCGKPLTMTPNGPMHEASREPLKAWHHGACGK